MNKKTSIIIVVILLVIMMSGAYVLVNKKDTTQSSSPRVSETNNQQEINTVQQPVGTYIDYEDEIIARTSGTKILFFHAPWCPQCRQLDEDIKAKGLPAGVTVIKVDYDSMQELRQKYGVPLQTTLVKVDDQGNLVKKFVAYDDPSVQALKDNLL